MDYWIPNIVFVVTGILTVAAEHVYFRAMTRRGLGVRDDNEFAAEVLSTPSRLPVIVAEETWQRLRTLATRQQDHSLERRRLLACAAIAVSVASFAWVLLAN
jgi:hypothetical protein